MQKNLSLFIIVRADRTHFERGVGRSCISIDRDHGRSIIGISGSKLGPSRQQKSWSWENPEEVKTLEW